MSKTTKKLPAVKPLTKASAVKVGAPPVANREKISVEIGARSPAFKRK